MKRISIFLLLFSFGLTAQAQDLKIAPVFGPNISFAGFFEKFRTDQLGNFSSNGIKGKARSLATIRVQAGIMANYSLSTNLSLQTGILLSLRGYNLKIKASGNNSNVKFLRIECHT